MKQIIKKIAVSLQVREEQVNHTLQLLKDGATIPFISRYRKEVTGGLDEVYIEQISLQYEKLCELQKRKETILSTIKEQGRLIPELEQQIADVWNSAELEDLYLPFKPKRRTRAEIARQHGLEPLADIIRSQREKFLEQRAVTFVKGDVRTLEEAFQGARDIIAERINEYKPARDKVRYYFERKAYITAKVIKGKEEAAVKYKDYYAFEELLNRCSSHRLLAMRRGEEEGFLRVSISPLEDEECVERLGKLFIHSVGMCADHIKIAVQDAYKRLLKPSIETEFAALSKEKADKEAIEVFAENLRQLLLASPLGQKRVLAIDPGYRTGCKVVCLDAQGSLLHNETIYPHPPRSERMIAARKLIKLVEQYAIEAIAIGNGTAGRETEDFVTSQQYDRELQVFVVSENGASVYSASKVARDEFPEYDVTVRGAVSIGRRLMDPLAELVKIDPKSIGVGQYQHDVDQVKLKQALDQTVMSCVNAVGVNVNTASKHLLTYISGLGPVLAQNIVDYRTEYGPFRSRSQLMKVPRMGVKAFEQSAGFLRIPFAENPLDASAVHPERYELVERMAQDVGCSVNQLIEQEEFRKKIYLRNYIQGEVGLPTLTDIMNELEKPGRDPRKRIKVFEFDRNIRTIQDLRPGMELNGVISNITNFGCFVDLGIHESGLVHISQLGDRFITNPNEVVSLHQQIRVRVLEIDLSRSRISLTLKGVNQDL